MDMDAAPKLLHNPTVMPMKLLAETLHLEYVEGANDRFPGPHSTGWRQLPFAVCGQISRGFIQLDFGDGRVLRCGNGQAFLVPAGVRNCVEKVSSGLLVSHYAHFRLTLLETVDVFDLVEVPNLVGRAAGERIGRICDQLAGRPPEGSGVLPLAAVAARRALEYELAAAILGLGKLKPQAADVLEEMRRFAPVFRLIRDDLARPFTVADLAAATHLSPSRFHSVFKRVLHVAPLAYVQRLRMERARTLLAITGQSVKEIGIQVGYADPCHFSRLFKKLSGLRPREYRDRVRRSLRGTIELSQ